MIGSLNEDDQICVHFDDEEIYAESRVQLQRWWAETSYRIQAMRDNSDCAKQEFDTLLDAENPGLHAELSYDINEDVAAPFIQTGNPSEDGNRARAGC